MNTSMHAALVASEFLFEKPSDISFSSSMTASTKEFMLASTRSHRNLSLASIAALARANEWVDGIDRSSLGKFAVPREILAATLAARLLHVEYLADKITFSIVLELHSLRDEMLANVKTGRFGSFLTLSGHVKSDSPLPVGSPIPLPTQIDAEFYLWQILDGVTVEGNFSVLWKPLVDSISFLTYVHNTPAALPYFEAGIVGTELVNDYISKGIDCELAVSVGV